MGDKIKKPGINPVKALAQGWSKYSYIFVFAIILIVYAITINANGNSFNPGHISGILSSQNTVIVGTMAIGMAMVIITGQIDLSIGSSLVLNTFKLSSCNRVCINGCVGSYDVYDVYGRRRPYS